MAKTQKLFHTTSCHSWEGVGGRGKEVLPSGLAQLGKGSSQVLLIVRGFLHESFITCTTPSPSSISIVAVAACFISLMFPVNGLSSTCNLHLLCLQFSSPSHHWSRREKQISNTWFGESQWEH